LQKTALFRRNLSLETVARYGSTGMFTATDALQFLQALRPGIADVVFLDPPFNLGKNYGIASRVEVAPPAEYQKYLKAVVEESTRVLADGGSLFMYHVPYWAARMSQYLQEQLTFRHWIAVSMKNGFVRGRKLYPAHYALLYYTKGAARLFNRPRYPAYRCRHCGDLVKDYGGYRHIVEKQGLNLSDVWDDLSPVRHKSNKVRAANQLPLRLTDRVLQIAGSTNALLVDPFVGSGTSVVSAVRHNMRFLANDLSRRNVRLSMRRLEAETAG
jgi:site-specific DNA-methyltransferase (adenine-specific)